MSKRFSKSYNPSKKKRKARMSRTDADTLAAKRAFDDRCDGIDLPLSFYDHISDELCGKPSRHIYSYVGEKR